MSYLGILLVTILLAWAGLSLFKKRKILDKPGNDLKNTRKPIPTLQGIFVYIMVLAILAIFHPEFFFSPLVQGFLVGGTIIVIVELFAELEYMGRISWKIPPWFRFLIHFLSAGIALWISGLSDYTFLL
ncbi:MAG: hypothetical protein LBO09_01075 [Candidatus Peribacteria bacterium]|jgi:UDP-N-acetylmuramyl pentapeptide phosphotransferase/UDP-N-acetylglucosamine-1-phosphate transferase|nr:hypothetical protein [Candidatus Peribacteria bacterium]